MIQQATLERVEQLANELLKEVDDVDDDAVGELDAAESIRQMRNERMAQICRKDV